MTAADNKQLVSDAYDALIAGNVKEFLGILADDIEVREPDPLPYGGTYNGIKELLGMFAKAGPVLDTPKMTVESLTADEDRVVATLTIPLRNGAGDALLSEHWRLAGGKATQLHVYWFDTTLAATPAAA